MADVISRDIEAFRLVAIQVQAMYLSRMRPSWSMPSSELADKIARRLSAGTMPTIKLDTLSSIFEALLLFKSVP